MKNNIVHEVDIIDITHFVYQHIQTDVPQSLGFGYERRDLTNLFARGIEKYINPAKLRLLGINDITFHHDSKKESFFYFMDAVVKVTAEGVNKVPYSSLNSYVWKKQIRPYNITLLDSNEPAGDFEKFCLRVCNNDVKRRITIKIINKYQFCLII